MITFTDYPFVAGRIEKDLDKCGYPHVIQYYAKVFYEPSHFGINNGTVSKLTIVLSGKQIVNYERGWDVRPSGKIEETAYRLVMADLEKCYQ